MRIKKVFNIMITAILIFTSLTPVLTVKAEQVFQWPSTWYAYTDKDNNPIRDIAGEVSPSDTDITSGVDNGYGKLPSVYVAADSTNLYVRFRMKADPYDRKGGFLSTAWVVQIFNNIGGTPTHVATIGLDGKSPSIDYVYVANGDGSKVNKVSQTDGTVAVDKVPGTEIVEAENGQYFLDFQVPVSEITDVAGAVDLNHAILYFGTSKAANLSVINKEWMTDDTANNIDYSKLNVIDLTKPGDALSDPKPIGIDYPTITIDFITNPYSSNDITINGTTSLTGGIVNFELNGVPSTRTAPINADGTWQLVNRTSPTDSSSGLIPDQNGTYILTAKVSSGMEIGQITVETSKELVIDKGSSTDAITISRGSIVYTNDPYYIISGTYAGPTTALGNSKVRVSFKEGQSYVEKYVMSGNGQNWSISDDTSYSTNKELYKLALEENTTQRIYDVEAQWTANNVNKETDIFATAKQTIVFIPIPSQGEKLLSVSIGSIIPSGSDATPVISGTSTGAGTIEVQRDDGQLIGIVKPVNDVWSIKVERPLSTGDHPIKAIAVNQGGTEAAFDTEEYNVNQTAVTIDNGAGPITINNNTPAIRGGTNAPNGSTVTVNIVNAIGSVLSYSDTVTVDNGRWEIVVPPGSKLDDGTYMVTASLASGGTATAAQTLKIDASTSVAIAAPANGSTITETKKPTISGTADTDASINLIVTNSSNNVVIVNSSVASDGTWSYTPSENMTDGAYSVEASAVDLYGNEDTKNSTFTISSETANVGTLGVTDGTDSGTKGDRITNIGNPVLNFTGEMGLIITVERLAGAPLTEGQYSIGYADGEYTVTLLDANTGTAGNQPFGTYYNGTATNNPANTEDGTYAIKASKNGGPNTTVGTFEIDTTPPAVPTVVSQTAATTKPTITGTATVEEDEVLTVTVNGKTYEEEGGNPTLTGNTWTLVIPTSDALSSGTYEVTATATDTAGNSASDATANELIVNVAGPAPTGNTGGGNTAPPQTTTTVKGDVIDGNTGESIKGIPAQVSTDNNGTKTVSVKSDEAILLKQPDGTTNSINDIAKLSFSSPVSSGESTNAPSVVLNSDGTIQVKNLSNGTETKFDVTLDLGNGQKIIIGSMDVKVSANGDVSLTSTLIDPYGVVVDEATGKPVPGVNITLYYADTDRNRTSGIVPDTVVQLPVMDGFKPNNNQNPQVSDASGVYAFMVFPNTDYYVVAEKEGYIKYISPTISVEKEMVKWSFNLHIRGVERISGQGRIETALEIARTTFPNTVSNVILATSENYPDALAGSVLAYKLSAPILLVGSSEEDQAKVMSYLKEKMDPKGTAYILGGTGAVSQGMESKVASSGFSNIKRLGGADRYETAVKIAEELGVKEGTPVVIVSGENYPDALSISSTAAVNQYPILLVTNDGIINSARQEISKINPDKEYIIGLDGVVSTAVEDKVIEASSNGKETALRIGGTDRFKTSLEVAKYFSLPGDIVCVTTGNNFPDALAGSMYGSLNRAPIMLVDESLSDDEMMYFKSKNISGATIFGGEGAVRQEIMQQLSGILKK